MDMTGEHRIPAPRQRVWEALNDPTILQQCIPGCEEIERTTLSGARERLADRPARGEYVLIVGPGCAGEQPPATDEEVSELLRRRIETGDSVSAAARAISAETGRARREVYQLALQLQSERRHEASGGPR